MRPLLLALLLGLWPSQVLAHLDLVFLIDTTGSMAGEIREAKERVRDLTEALRSSRPSERIRLGVVAYRDRGDAYLTRVSPLSADINVSYTFLATLTADGGGDTPEDVLSGVHAALYKLSWDEGPDTERQVFIIADAPPHLDYRDRPTPESLISEALRRRIVINGIGCRSLGPDGIAFFRRLAYATEGSYQHIGRVRAEEDGLARAMLTALAPTPAAEDPSRLPTLPLLPASAAAPSSLGNLQVIPYVDRSSGSPRCGLQVDLPPGLALAASPIVRRGADALHVQLSLTQGQGGSPRFTLPECPRPGTPLRVHF